MSLIAGAILMLAASDGSVVATDAAGAKADKDPVICHRIQEVGSLLRSRKVCMRKSEWEEQNREDKQMIDRAQVQRRMDGGN